MRKWNDIELVIPNTHRRRRSESTVKLSRVGGVNIAVGSRDPVYNFLCCWAIEVVDTDKWRHNTSLLKKLSISIKIHVVKSQWAFSKLSIECVGSGHELVGIIVFTPPTPTRLWSHPACWRYINKIVIIIITIIYKKNCKQFIQCCISDRYKTAKIKKKYKHEVMH